MTRLLILVEGQSEETFVKNALAPHLERRGVFVEPPVLLWTKRRPSGGGFRGGVSNWSKIRSSLMPLMKDSDAWVSSLLDFYGLPDDFPGLSETLAMKDDPRQRVKALQGHFAKSLNSHQRFIPFLALHEFEAWLFSAPAAIAEHFGESDLAGKLSLIVEEAGAPELINHGLKTHPKARLRDLIKNYKEASDGPTLLEKIGLAAVRAACPHFDCWVSRLESLNR